MHVVERNGAAIPALGFGTWDLRMDVARRLVEAALELGYRHIDTAQAYGNEVEVGAAIRAAALPRQELFLTTKIWPDRFRPDDLEASVEESLHRLGLPQVDLLLLHWPNQDVPLAATIEALNVTVQRGWTRHIGISNFTAAMVDEAVRLSAAPLVANQVEYHPFLAQKTVAAACRRHGMALTAYCPLARGRVFSHSLIDRIAKAHGKTAGQVTLRWLVQQEGVVAIPRSSQVENARANLEIFDFQLNEAEMEEIAALGDPKGRLVNVAGLAPVWDAA